jgi:signal transduction histidine kinase
MRIVGFVGVLVVGLAIAIVTLQQAKFAYVDSTAWLGVETASAIARLFGALILLLFPDDRARPRFRWIAAGMIVLGLSGLGFNYIARSIDESLSLNQSMYASIVVRTIAGSLFAIGLIADRPPHFSSRVLALTTAGFVAGSLLVAAVADRLPQLITINDLIAAAERGETPLRGLTMWHWSLSTIPTLVILAAVIGAIRHRDSIPFGNWLVMAMVLLAGSQLHNMLWPAVFSPILTTGNILRLAFSAVVVIGGTLELRRVATERAIYMERMAEVARLKADFTSMVAHELASPLAAIRGYLDMLALDDLDQATRSQAIAAVRRETDVLRMLVADVRASVDIEHDDFVVQMQPNNLQDIIDSAVMYANTLPGDHQVHVDVEAGVVVLADQERIGQVLRNLLNNAARYSPAGTPITIRATQLDGVVRMQVEDHGFGIHPDDMEHIFTKFGRGRHHLEPRISGDGLGLYLSQAIVRAHGSRLQVSSRSGEGSIFSFELQVIP